VRSRAGRHRDRGEASYQREHEQEFGGEAMHSEGVRSLPTYRCRKQRSRRQNIWPLLVMSATYEYDGNEKTDFPRLAHQHIIATVGESDKQVHQD
jgi:hypothetical protein